MRATHLGKNIVVLAVKSLAEGAEEKVAANLREDHVDAFLGVRKVSHEVERLLLQPHILAHEETVTCQFYRVFTVAISDVPCELCPADAVHHPSLEIYRALVHQILERPQSVQDQVRLSRPHHLHKSVNDPFIQQNLLRHQ